MFFQPDNLPVKTTGAVGAVRDDGNVVICGGVGNENSCFESRIDGGGLKWTEFNQMNAER